MSKFEGVLNFRLCNVVSIIKHDKYCLRWGFYNFMPSEDILILLKVKKNTLNLPLSVIFNYNLIAIVSDNQAEVPTYHLVSYIEPFNLSL